MTERAHTRRSVPSALWAQPPHALSLEAHVQCPPPTPRPPEGAWPSWGVVFLWKGPQAPVGPSQ